RYLICLSTSCFFFFFQAEDGIRDRTVTGVQTCALPILATFQHEEGQRRFCDTSVEAYLSRVEMLRAKGVPIGVAPHSVRAVPEEWFRAIADYSRTHHLPLHVHAGEQRAEIEQTRAAYNCTPIELLERFDALSPLATIIHATHASDEEIALLAQHGSAVCVCPTTEGDLGDGIAPYAAFLSANLPRSIGSDSNAGLDRFHEL